MIKKYNQFLKENKSEDIKDTIQQYFYEVTDNFDCELKIFLDGNNIIIQISLPRHSRKLSKEEYLKNLDLKKKIYECVYYLETEEIIKDSVFTDAESVIIYCSNFNDNDSFYLDNNKTVFINYLNLKKELSGFNLPIDWDSLEQNNPKLFYLPFTSDVSVDDLQKYLLSKYDFFDDVVHREDNNDIHWVGFKLKEGYYIDINY